MKSSLQIALAIIIVLATVAGVAILAVEQLLPQLTLPNPGPVNPTPNVTAVAQWTPTPGGEGQMNNAIATAFPTPPTRITVVSMEALRNALMEKLYAASINWTLLSQIERAGVAWRCEDVTLGDNGPALPDGRFGSLAAIWAGWYGGFDVTQVTAQDITITPGKTTTTFHSDQNGSYYEQAPMAIITIRIDSFGVVGPEINAGNEVFLTTNESGALTGALTTFKSWVWGVDLATEKRTRNTNMARDWAVYDSIAPLNPNGTRNEDYLWALYNIMAASFDPSISSYTLPNGEVIDIDHTVYAEMMRMAQEAATLGKYAGVEKLIIVVDKPRSIYDFIKLANNRVQVLPNNLPTLVLDTDCPQFEVSDQTLTDLSTNSQIPPEALEDIIARIRDVRK